MEEIYKSLFSCNNLLAEQFVRQMFELGSPDGAVLIYVDENHKYQSNNASRAAFLYEEPEQLSSICNQIDDGDDPCVYAVDDGCVVGTQLATERGHLGYFLAFLANYTSQTVWANMDIIELMLGQAQLICQFIEKNNQLHHLRLEHLSKSSKVLS